MMIKPQMTLAKGGDSDAQFNLALRYQDGKDLPQDYAKARYWYRRAAHQGHAPAQYSLGLLLGKGLGDRKDERAAAAWYRMAAERGHQAAQFNLAAMYEAGEGLPRNLVLAYVWFALAGAGGANGPYRMSFKVGLPAFQSSLAVSKGNRTASQGNRNRLALLLSIEERELAELLAGEYYVKYVFPFR